jgi:adenosylcobinamide kinase/adenosylcobinamide-phosphate guanylyltransferase
MIEIANRTILILGGARSGKSTYAQQLASGMGERVLFCATAEPLDLEMRHRIEQHKNSRPASWETLEVSREVGRALSNVPSGYDAVIIDCITLLVSNCLQDETESEHAAGIVFDEISGLTEYMSDKKSNYILVSNEVGGGLVPDNILGRLYRDMLGRANQLLAKASDEVYLMIAGIPVKIK